MNPSINDVAKILSDKSCSQMLMLFMDGKFHTVTELAKVANIKNHTATYHLKKLTELSWLEKEIHGRFHYYRLCNGEIAEIIEQWMPVTKIQPVKSLNMNNEKLILFQGRTCYDHLAGKLGVELTKWMIEKNFITENGKESDITEKGIAFLTNCGINVDLLRKQKRCFCKMCMDWSEREHHLAGSVGKAVADYLFTNQWIEPFGKSRGIRLTKLGEQGLSDVWGAPHVAITCCYNK